MKILITGGCGFVGTNLGIYLKRKGYKISSLDNLSRKGSRYNLKLIKKYDYSSEGSTRAEWWRTFWRFSAVLVRKECQLS